MSMRQVYRCFAEKRPGFDVEAGKVLRELREQLGVSDLEGVRIICRYDVDQVERSVYEMARTTVFSEPMVDDFYEETLPEILQRWVDEGKGYRVDRMIGRWLGRLINGRMGQPKLIAGLSEGAELPKDLACEEGGALSRTQGVFFAIYKDGVLCFLKGKTRN